MASSIKPISIYEHVELILPSLGVLDNNEKFICS